MLTDAYSPANKMLATKIHDLSIVLLELSSDTVGKGTVWQSAQFHRIGVRFPAIASTKKNCIYTLFVV
mgnify:CR=1 FL=1